MLKSGCSVLKLWIIRSTFEEGIEADAQRPVRIAVWSPVKKIFKLDCFKQGIFTINDAVSHEPVSRHLFRVINWAQFNCSRKKQSWPHLKKAYSKPGAKIKLKVHVNCFLNFLVMIHKITKKSKIRQKLYMEHETAVYFSFEKKWTNVIYKWSQWEASEKRNTLAKTW